MFGYKFVLKQFSGTFIGRQLLVFNHENIISFYWKLRFNKNFVWGWYDCLTLKLFSTIIVHFLFKKNYCIRLCTIFFLIVVDFFLNLRLTIANREFLYLHYSHKQADYDQSDALIRTTKQHHVLTTQPKSWCIYRALRNKQPLEK